MNYAEFKKRQMLNADNFGVVSGVPPLQLQGSKAKPLRNYHVYGATSGVGDLTKNLFDKDAKNTANGFIKEHYIDSNNTSQSFGQTNVSEYIEVTENTVYFLYNNRSGVGNACICWYDADKVFLSSVSAKHGQKTSPSGAEYCRISYWAVDVNILMFIQGTAIPTIYEPYNKYKIPITISANPNFANLPSGYQQVEYLESSGTQYIDLGITASATDFKWESKVNFGDTMQSTSNCTFGAGESGKYLYALSTLPNHGVFSEIGVVYTPTYSSTFIAGELVEKFTMSNGTYNGQLNDIVKTGTYNTSSIPTTNTLYMFCTHYRDGNPKYYMNGRYYYLKIWKDGTLTLNLIPTRRTSDSVLGMYDLVSGTFFTNQGTGTFTAGADVTGSVVNVYANSPLTKSGDVADYLDYSTQKIYRDTATPPTEESVTIPSISALADGCYCDVKTSVQPSNMYVKYAK